MKPVEMADVAVSAVRGVAVAKIAVDVVAAINVDPSALATEVRWKGVVVAPLGTLGLGFRHSDSGFEVSDASLLFLALCFGFEFVQRLAGLPGDIHFRIGSTEFVLIAESRTGDGGEKYRIQDR